MAQKRKKTRTRKNNPTRLKPERRLTGEEIERFRQNLLERRREILGDMNEMENEALKQSRMAATGDLSSMPIHMADLGTDNFEQEFALGLMDSERKLLKEIDNALQRIENGAYGICEGTGKQIPRARLQAYPWARYCIEYARMLEKGIATGRENHTWNTGDEIAPEEQEEI